MRRYLIAAVVAELVGLVGLWAYVVFLQGGAHQQMVTGTYFHSVPKTPPILWGLASLSGLAPNPGFESCLWHNTNALMLARTLDLLDNILPFLFGFPAIAVLSLWTFDRRKQNSSA
jgi:hypothetical protein